MQGMARGVRHGQMARTFTAASSSVSLAVVACSVRSFSCAPSRQKISLLRPRLAGQHGALQRVSATHLGPS